MNAQEWKSGHFTLDVVSLHGFFPLRFPTGRMLAAVSATPWLPMQQPSAANKRSFVAIVQGKWILGRCENSCTNKFTSAVFDVAPNEAAVEAQTLNKSQLVCRSVESPSQTAWRTNEQLPSEQRSKKMI
ncbi:LexA repressor [Trichinella spiralis]|uniref:LexA repressor n=1 Tax=Trichinella spiralis TaxID=6334 RepID=A0ABR3K9Z0_TRISP